MPIIEELPSRYWQQGPEAHGRQVGPQMNGDGERKVETVLVGPNGKSPLIQRVTAPRPVGFQSDRAK